MKKVPIIIDHEKSKAMQRSYFPLCTHCSVGIIFDKTLHTGFEITMVPLMIFLFTQTIYYSFLKLKIQINLMNFIRNFHQNGARDF